MKLSRAGVKWFSCKIGIRAYKFTADFSDHHIQDTGQYLYLFLQKAGLLKYLNYQNTQILIGMREIVRALYLTILYFSSVFIHLVTFTCLFIPPTDKLNSLMFMKCFDLQVGWSMKMLLVLSLTLTNSLQISLCCRTSRTTLKPLSWFRRFG